MRHNVNGAVNFTRKSWVATKRFKFMFLVALFCSTSYFISFHSLYNGTSYTIRSGRMKGCSIPILHPMDESVKKFVYKPDVPRCLNPDNLPLDHNQTHIWIKREFRELNGTFSNDTLLCCYRAFSRPAYIKDINTKVDNRVAFDECRDFSDTINVTIGHEFVKVNCSIENITVEQFFLFTPKKTFMSHSDEEEIQDNTTGFNVLVLGIDAVSRLNFYRTMPKTVQYLKNKGAVDLSGYNKVGDNTFPNLIPMLLGISVDELKTTCLPYKNAKFDNCPFLWEWYKQAGYYTALAEDSSWLGTFNYLKAGFSRTPTDYYLHTFINEAEDYVDKIKRVHSNATSLCLNEKYFYKILLDYVENLSVTLKSTKLFGFFWEVTMTHDHLNYPMVMDNDYVHFFNKLEQSNYLNNTIIFLLSDHGIRWGGIRYTKQGRIEERLPFVFILVPPAFRNTYNEAFKNLQFNSNRLTTPYDVHATLHNLVNLQNINNDNILLQSKARYANKRGISLFLPIPSDRTCEMAGISDHWCTCHMEHKISRKSAEAREAATFLVKYLNSLLKHFSRCATLRVAKIMQVSEMLVGKPDEEESDSWREFLLTIKTLPGEGVFEATMRNSSSLQWTVSGTVSRLNLYGNQSSCVEDNQLKLYCFCT